MAIGKAGARNAGVFAVQVLSLSNAGLHRKLSQYKQTLEAEVHKKAEELELKLKRKT
jgi:phosphoribosylcarboxyaminoimidazole (NCAIR) mutase